MAHTRMVPVRLTVVAQDDIEAVGEAVGALGRRDQRLRRLAHEAHEAGGSPSWTCPSSWVHNRRRLGLRSSLRAVSAARRRTGEAARAAA
jgi:Protein of unknown function (DUF1670)